jgi:hypothetical protein
LIERFCRCEFIRTQAVDCANKFAPTPKATNHFGPSLGKGVMEMLETLAIVLVIMWILGLVSSYTLGGLIHILLVIAIIMIVLRVIQGRRAL